MTPADFCAAVADALLDPGAPRPSGMEAHLAGCAACRRLAEAHRAAERLRGAPGPGGPAIGLDQVLARVRSRRRARAAAGGAVAVAVGIALALGLPREVPRRAGGEDVFALAESVRGYSQRDLATEDPVLVAFAPLTRWLAPPPRSSLDLPSLAPPSGGVSP